jgi:hypothetical protein
MLERKGPGKRLSLRESEEVVQEVSYPAIRVVEAMATGIEAEDG